VFDFIAGIIAVFLLIICLCVLNEIIEERWERVVFTIIFTGMIVTVSIYWIGEEILKVSIG
jgi:small neutral amino acid transporter SnatA (MarC family)